MPSHLVLIPSYNTGPLLASTVAEVLAHWPEVWVVIDGSDDGSDAPLDALATRHAGLRVIRRPHNGGKGSAVLTGVEAALEAGFTHVLTMDADGQHSAAHIAPFIEASRARPGALILGKPVFGPEAPLERLQGRKISIGLVHLHTGGRIIGDPLFGFRVYPAAALRRALNDTRTARGYDFDPEVAVRLVWAGLPVVNLPAPCRYLAKSDGGVSHFNYLRDNLKMARLHLGLFAAVLFRRRRTLRHVAIPLVIGLLFLLSPAANSTPPDATPPDVEPLAPLFEKLRAATPLHAAFVERRQLALKRTPIELSGEVRIHPELGLSLHYLPPAAQTLIADDAGVLARDARGRTRSLPPSPATEPLLHLLRFDLESLRARFEIVRIQEPNTEKWRIECSPLEEAGARMTVVGEADRIESIVLETGAQRTEIVVTHVRERHAFTDEERARYFR